MRPSALRLLAFLVVTALGVQGHAGLAQGQAPSFRSAIDLVSLNITVTDGSSRYITDLNVEEFSVFEDGVHQDLTFFNRTNLPIALSLLLDTSSSMEERLGMAQEAAIGFARQLRPQDLAEVVDFDSRVEVRQEYTNDKQQLERAIRRTVDTSSLVGFDEVLDLAKRSETAIFCIGLQSHDASSSRGFREATFALRQLATQTGGRVFFIDDVKQLAGVYQQISDELSSQYTVGYTSKNPRRDGTWRRIIVRIERPGLTVRTKQGYYAPTGP